MAGVTMTLTSQSAKLEQSRGGGLKSSQKRYSKKGRVALVPPGLPRPHSTNVRRLHGSAEKESADSTDDHRAPRSPRGFFFVQTKTSGASPPTPHHRTLAPENLRAGCFDLYVTITDDLSGAEATRVAAFRIVE